MAEPRGGWVGSRGIGWLTWGRVDAWGVSRLGACGGGWLTQGRAGSVPCGRAWDSVGRMWHAHPWLGGLTGWLV
jgi:hypothetical protein